MKQTLKTKSILQKPTAQPKIKQNRNKKNQQNPYIFYSPLLMPNPRHSMLSQSNMSNIIQSIEQYSMNFDESKHSQYISEAISVSKTNNNISMSRPSKVMDKKNAIKIVDKQADKPVIKKTQESIIQQQDDKENASNANISRVDNRNQPINLGDEVFKVIAERYREAQGNQTYDHDVLFDFYKRQKKNFNPSKSTMKNITMDDIGALMPAAQRKMLLKAQFQKILTYYPHDVYFTLACGAEKHKKDLELESKTNKLNFYMQQRPQSKRKNVSEVVERLYPLNKSDSQRTKPNEVAEYQKRNLFGTRLLQHFINHFRNNSDPPEPTAEKLFEFWEDTYERQEYGIEWDEATAQKDIKLFMMEQVQNLLVYLEKKLGFKALNEAELKKFYLQYAPIQNIAIPPKYFKAFINAYNDIMKENDQKRSQEEAKKMKERESKQKQKEIKRFGRPVSATPISVLSKPKTTTNLNDLSAYKNDKILSTILLGDKSKIARRPFEYGIYNMEQEIKTKGRIKPKEKQNFEQTIFKQLAKTFTDANFFNAGKSGRVIDILGEEEIEKEKNWTDLGPVLQQAMLVECYEQLELRNALAKYCQKLCDKDFKFADDKTIVQELMKSLNAMNEEQRGDEISILQTTLRRVEEKILREKNSKQSYPKSANIQTTSRNLFYSFLTDKACKFVQMRVKHEQINLRKYMNEIFEQAMRQEKYSEFVKKHFHVVQGEKQCPKLLKYQFFRLQKDINPITLQKDPIAKCHAWIPIKNGPESFNYKTFNTYSNAYKIDKNKIVGKEEPDSHKRSLWGYKKDKAKLRENLLMTFEDAKECVFHPKISRVQ